MTTKDPLYTYKSSIFTVDQDKLEDANQYNWQALPNYIDLDYDSADVKQSQELYEEIPKSLFKKRSMNDRDYFLFYFFTLLPSKNESRYEILKNYTSKNYNYGLEYKLAIEFETQARVKENVYAIEDAVKYYVDNFLKDGEFKYELFHNFDNSKINITTDSTPPPPAEPYIHNKKKSASQQEQEVKYTEIFTIYNSKPFENYIKHIEQLTELVKNLTLVPYHLYTEHSKFEHWAINPFIYEIVNFVYHYDNTVRPSQYTIISSDEKNKITTFQITSKFENIHQYHRTMQMKSSMKLEQNIALNYESALGEKKLTELETDILQLDVNRNIINNTVRYSYYYPKIKEYSTLNIEVDLSTNSKQIKAYLTAIIDNLDEVVASKVLPDLFAIPVEDSSNIDVANAFFAYDYYTYRVEQLSHRKQYTLSLGDDEGFNNEQQEHAQLDKATSQRLYQEILAIRDSSKTIKSIEQEINKIANLIESAKKKQKII